MKLNNWEIKIQLEFEKKLKISKKSSKKLTVIGMTGLVGSGKSTVAIELQRITGFTVVRSDLIRKILKKNGKTYSSTRKIAEYTVRKLLSKGISTILDADMVRPDKRSMLNTIAKKYKARIFYVRTFLDDNHKMIDRITNNEFDNFDVSRTHEMWRRTPLHYKWVDEGDYSYWKLKDFKIKNLFEINTTTEKKWMIDVKKITDKIDK